MNPFRLTLAVIAGAALLSHPTRAQQPPETEADAVRMLASEDYRERDEAMFWVLVRTKAREPVGAELRAAMLRAAADPGWADGRPKIDPEANPDGWGELWSIYGDAVSGMRHPDAIPFMLARYGSPYDLAAIGRPALLPVIGALENPEANLDHTVDVAFRALTLMVHDGLPTEEERARIIAATRYRLNARLPIYSIVSAFGLAVTLGAPELLAIVERAANDRKSADAMRAAYASERTIDSVQEEAREALQTGFVPYVIRHRWE